MEKGYYQIIMRTTTTNKLVAIHNKNGKGLLPTISAATGTYTKSQSTIKMEKGYYLRV